MARGREPSFGRQPRDGGPHQPLGQPEGPGKVDQAAEGHGPAAGRDGITEDRHEQRPAAQWALAVKAAQQRLERFRERWHGGILARKS
jgi:hypothetical protein